MSTVKLTTKLEGSVIFLQTIETLFKKCKQSRSNKHIYINIVVKFMATCEFEVIPVWINLVYTTRLLVISYDFLSLSEGRYVQIMFNSFIAHLLHTILNLITMITSIENDKLSVSSFLKRMSFLKRKYPCKSLTIELFKAN